VGAFVPLRGARSNLSWERGGLIFSLRPFSMPLCTEVPRKMHSAKMR
jgi:hypothetical protein